MSGGPARCCTIFQFLGNCVLLYDVCTAMQLSNKNFLKQCGNHVRKKLGLKIVQRNDLSIYGCMKILDENMCLIIFAWYSIIQQLNHATIYLFIAWATPYY